MSEFETVDYDPSVESTTPPEIAEIAGGFVADAGIVFKAEHKLVPPPEPIRDESIGRSVPYESYYDDYENVPPPEMTIAEIIKNTEKWKKITGDYESSMNRKHYNNRRRHNFGVEWRVATRYRLPSEDYLVDDVGIQNRADLYRYLQQRGIVLMDDTGLDENGNKMYSPYGITMIPETVDEDDFYALEDIVRALYPFETDQFVLLKQQRMMAEGYSYVSEANADGFEVRSEEFRAPPDAIRKIVDQVSLDERFADMFAAGRDIVEARKHRPREEIDVDQATQDSELPTLIRKQPVQHEYTDYPTL